MKLTKGKISRMLKTNHQTLKRRPTMTNYTTKETPNHYTRLKKRPHLFNKTMYKVLTKL